MVPLDSMGAAWRNPTDKDLEIVCKMIKVSSLGLETCATLGMLNKKQAKKLSEAGQIIITITLIHQRITMRK